MIYFAVASSVNDTKRRKKNEGAWVSPYPEGFKTRIDKHQVQWKEDKYNKHAI